MIWLEQKDRSISLLQLLLNNSITGGGKSGMHVMGLQGEADSAVAAAAPSVNDDYTESRSLQGNSASASTEAGRRKR